MHITSFSTFRRDYKRFNNSAVTNINEAVLRSKTTKKRYVPRYGTFGETFSVLMKVEVTGEMHIVTEKVHVWYNVWNTSPFSSSYLWYVNSCANFFFCVGNVSWLMVFQCTCKFWDWKCITIVLPHKLYDNIHEWSVYKIVRNNYEGSQ